MQGLQDQDGITRCWWCGNDSLYQNYHDQEWGFPVADDQRLFEKVCLEGFQSGLSWITILKKRENFRKAFCDFEIEKVARFDQHDVERLVQDAGIIRHRGKIESAISNAHQAIKLIEEFGSLSSYFWKFKPSPETRPKKMDYDTVKTIAITPESTALSKDLKKRGWKFVGPTTMYAFMQSMGIVNDHLEGCSIRKPVQESLRLFDHAHQEG